MGAYQIFHDKAIDEFIWKILALSAISFADAFSFRTITVSSAFFCCSKLNLMVTLALYQAVPSAG
jgi:hypothetical protein